MKLNINDIYGIGQSIAISRAKDICKQISAEELNNIFSELQQNPEKLRYFLDGMRNTFDNAYFSLEH